MQRHVFCALVVGAIGGVFGHAAASAEPLSLQAERYRAFNARQAPAYQAPAYQAPAYIAPEPAPVVAEPESRIRHASAGPEINLGGGFIEFLFSGGRPVAPPQQHLERQHLERQHLERPQTEMMARAEPPTVRYEAARPAAQRAIDPKFHKQVVQYDGPHKPGTVIIDTPNRFLFLVQDNGTALRYGIGVGRPGFTWAGEKKVTAKKEWPDWVPPPEMLQRQPDLPTWMAGGPNNPLGARALYLGTSLYRIHGSNEPWTIGQAVSSGCIRMRNEDVIDLYEKVKVGTKVVVI